MSSLPSILRKTHSSISYFPSLSFSPMENTQKPSEQPPEKPQQHQTPPHKPTTTTATTTTKQRPIWDCGSALYDSFELNSFQKQLDSAIISSSRTFSMPRLPSQGGASLPHVPPRTHHVTPPPPPSSKLSRSFRKLLKSVFKAKNNNNNNNKDDHYYCYDTSPDPSRSFSEKPPPKEQAADGGGSKYFVVYEKVNALSTIPEVSESPEIGSLVRKTMSARFRSNSVGIYCG